MGWYYDREGREITMEEWSGLFGTHDYQRIVKTEVEFPGTGQEVTVSTVWLGLDHGWGSTRPVIFETMIFGLGEEYEPQFRYCTEGEAREHHLVCVELLKAGQIPGYEDEDDE